MHPYGSGRDAFFNISEDVGLAVGPGVVETGAASARSPWTCRRCRPEHRATVRFRLVNNDQDTETSVRIEDVFVPSANTAPILPPISDQATTEGGTLVVPATFSDPDAADTHIALIDWGDGTSGPVTITPTGPGTYAVSASHAYADDGSYSATLTVTDAAGESASTGFVSVVANASPSVTAGVSFRLAAGATEVEVAAAGEFIDPGFSRASAGTAETFSAELDWGDGTVESVQSTIVPGKEGQPTRGRFTAVHTFAHPGVYTARVTVRDDDDGAGTSDTRFGVARVNVTRALDFAAGGSVPVLVMRDNGFDATTIDVSTVRFAAGAARPANNVMQVRPSDVRFNFPVAQTGAHAEDTAAFLTGRLADGTPFAGVGAVSVVGGAAPPTPSTPASTKILRGGPRGRPLVPVSSVWRDGRQLRARRGRRGRSGCGEQRRGRPGLGDRRIDARGHRAGPGRQPARLVAGRRSGPPGGSDDRWDGPVGRRRRDAAGRPVRRGGVPAFRGGADGRGVPARPG